MFELEHEGKKEKLRTMRRGPNRKLERNDKHRRHSLTLEKQVYHHASPPPLTVLVLPLFSALHHGQLDLLCDAQAEDVVLASSNAFVSRPPHPASPSHRPPSHLHTHLETRPLNGVTTS